MYDSSSSLLRFLGMLAITACFWALPSETALAQDKVVKKRGNIVSINLEGKSLTIEKRTGGTQVVTWDDNTTLESTVVTAITDLQPGMFVRCIMVGQTDLVGRFRHEPQFDKAPGEAAAE